ncbi:hypothetical protein P691DRAFT_685393, partial [Macrolepiota fuliginosa MF-IS2]
LNRTKSFDLEQDVQLSRITREKEILELAKKHSRTREYIRCHLNQATHYRKHCRSQVHNVLVHHVGKLLNKDRAPGNHLNAQQINQEIEKNPQYKLLAVEKEKELLEELEENKATKKRGAQINDQATNHDFQNTIYHFHKEVNQIDSLSARTGCIGFAVFTRGHINNSTWSVCIGSKDTLDFFPEVLGISSIELAQRFDAWSVARTKSEWHPLNVETTGKHAMNDLQQECGKMIANGLNKAIGTTNTHMSYTNYDSDIRLCYKVQLQGWPVGVKFTSPSHITTMSEIGVLHRALSSEECSWVAMNALEVKELAQKLRDNPALKKTRKSRSDKGKKRGSHKRGDNQGNDPSNSPGTGGAQRNKRNKRAKLLASQVPPTYRSCSVVDSTDQE